MCRTEEQAIRYFKSKNRNMKKENNRDPNIEKQQIIHLQKFVGRVSKPNLTKPKAPNFKTRLAKIIEQVPEALP